MSNNNGQKLAGKVAIVTGGSRGIGAAIDLSRARQAPTMVRNRRSARDVDFVLTNAHSGGPMIPESQNPDRDYPQMVGDRGLVEPARQRRGGIMSAAEVTAEVAGETAPEPKRPGSSRIGLIVPSSNTTMETELPELFRRQFEATGHRYTFHSARAGMKTVNAEELLAMVGKAADCAAAVSDADVDVIAYACLVAVMAQGADAHLQSEAVIAEAAEANGHPAAVTSSAGALVRTLHELGARRVAMVTPYMKPLTKLVSDYVEGSGITVLDAVSLEVADNLAVGCLNPENLPGIARNLKREGADVIVLSACVQMPSLAAVQQVEDELDVPVITAATATAYEILKSLGHEPAISGAGSLLSGTAPSRVNPRA